MPPPPSCALLQIVVHDVAEASEQCGSTLRMAWHNLFVVNQLALVCHRWHDLVRCYSYSRGPAAVFGLFDFGVKTHKLGLLTRSGQRYKLPVNLRFPEFTDQVFDNVCDIALKMITWRFSRGRRMTQSFCCKDQLSIQVEPHVSIRGNWLAFWRPQRLFQRAPFLLLHRSTSETKIGELWTLQSEAKSLRRCRSTSHLIPLENDRGFPIPL